MAILMMCLMLMAAAAAVFHQSGEKEFYNFCGIS